jgi:hypothetical protein
VQPYGNRAWKEISKNLYYQNEGSFLEGENDFTSGELELPDSILKLKEKLEKKLLESQVIEKIEKLVCKQASPWDWNHEGHRAILLKDYLPSHLKHRRTYIIKQVSSAYLDKHKGKLDMKNEKEIEKRVEWYLSQLEKKT